MIIKIKDKEFDSKDITQLYPACIIKTGNTKDETTQVSLEWIEVEAKGKVEIVAYGIFVILKEEDDKHSFLFDTKDEMDIEIGNISSQLR